MAPNVSSFKVEIPCSREQNKQRIWVPYHFIWSYFFMPFPPIASFFSKVSPQYPSPVRFFLLNILHLIWLPSISHRNPFSSELPSSFTVKFNSRVNTFSIWSHFDISDALGLLAIFSFLCSLLAYWHHHVQVFSIMIITIAPADSSFCWAFKHSPTGEFSHIHPTKSNNIWSFCLLKVNIYYYQCTLYIYF